MVAGGGFVEFFTEFFRIAKQVVVTSIKIPLLIWFKYTPAPIRWVIISIGVVISLIAIRWAYKHRDDWESLY